MAPKVTRRLLKALGANCEDLDTFTTLFPRGARPTLGNILKAADANISVAWFAYVALPERSARNYERGMRRFFNRHTRTNPYTWDDNNKAVSKSLHNALKGVTEYVKDD